MSYSPSTSYPAHHQYHHKPPQRRSPTTNSLHDNTLRQHPHGHGPDHYHHSYHDHRHHHQPTTSMSTRTTSPGDPDSAPPLPFPATHHHHQPLSRTARSNSIPRLATSAERSPYRSPAASSATPATKRPKSHVASACIHCKKAHLACDVSRPCARCVGLGKQDTCHDVQHKKRGRPRLRDERHSFEVGHSSPISSPTAHSSSLSYRSSHRVLKSQPSLEHHRLRRPTLTPREDNPSYTTTSYFDYHDVRGSKISLPPINNPPHATAFLTCDLVIVKSTERVRELLGYSERELDGRQNLLDIVLSSDRDEVHRLSDKIQDEIHQRVGRQTDVQPRALYPLIQDISEADIPVATQGYRKHTGIFHFRRPDGSHLRIRMQATAGFQHVHFVVVDFSLAHEMPPPLQLHNGDSPLPTPSSHPHSAGSASGLNSPSFLTTGSQRPLQPEHFGPQSPYSNHHSALAIDRPRSGHPDNHYHPPPPSTPSSQPQYAPYPSPTHPPSTYYNHPPPSSSYSSKHGFISPESLQLPPLQLPPYSEPPRREHNHYEVPRRHRIGVHEMLD
ncbi:hypothetical protein EX30DRAFT_364222 [Ascodesmis nigricans]|uniref:Zn(2)-C6 fungal-type domain-containing protein n=1 Tax=Ascodesmis nigricans TaxID=341454 RepID=A0A4S2MW40_9PEZI|nr:hypothetical protein EX30DRAFT_364222 [Ascodesmis nigricans]